MKCAKLAGAVLAVWASWAGGSELTGVGSFIPVPLYAVWGNNFAIRNPGSVIKYQPISPAEGIKRITEKSADFAGIDMPLNIKDLNQKGLVQYPLALGGVAPIVNLENVYPGQLKLDGKTLGDILLGKITRWNDPALVALNPQTRLPDAEIFVVHRATKPGVRTVIGNYLGKVHPEWESKMGDSLSGTWPANSKETKDINEMKEAIQQTPNSIGYMEVSHIMRNKLVYVQMRNRDGHFVSPGDENIASAAENVKWNPENGFDEVLTNQPGVASWPISMSTIILLRKVAEQPERSQELLNFVNFGYRLGQLSALQNGYVPLPTSVAAVIRNSWKTGVVDASNQPVWKR